MKEVKTKQAAPVAEPKKEKRADKPIEKKAAEAVPAANEVKEVKKVEKQKLRKKIEDFNKFTKLKSIKEAKKKKELGEVISLDAQTVQKAIQALLDFQKRQKESSKSLVEEEDEFVYVEVTLNKLPESYSIRPFPM